MTEAINPNQDHAAMDLASNLISTMSPNQQEEMISRIGHMTRSLHDNLSALGYDKVLEQVAQEIPDARDRLSYVAKMTEQAAERVLNATDLATPLQSELSDRAAVLKQRWEEVMQRASLKSEYDAVVHETLEYMSLVSQHTSTTKSLLMDIMMAQDFQDLTGQVIKKVTSLAQDLERQLVQVLVDFSPAAKKDEDSLMNGPQIDPHNTVDVVANQEQVDDLLESLGF
ncbi:MULTISPECIES: protein phosphatase CheZ [unclassified Methylophilus]|uniref:Protein phosphatase CheZ n=1 Tax=Methylophilus glucosoxydans TaxID=752553 RepID=A0ABW3GHU5_9PROT|nr:MULTISPECIES: protein phosphatase CheZ [unclassified Methylophilus]MBF5037871.1 protein phosphatase CheZ [Methylophilus sp. 13]MDF0376852.1 protein phosphatase CheZ [Methylophilus sp. YYY-1]MDT7850748.1 protein phosphatase CheZ [Methylophilus sp. VKM B-3414]BEV08128.1 protein phosphatase CheZ [Methylophilus sp. DW102]